MMIPIVLMDPVNNEIKGNNNDQQLIMADKIQKGEVKKDNKYIESTKIALLTLE